MAVYVYTRVSTARQAEEGESIAVQERTVAGYAQMHGLSIDRVFPERGISGSKPLAERPEGAALLATLRAGDVLITPKLDRMFRSASDALANLETIKRKGVALHMIDLGGDVTGNGIAKLVFTILSAVAEAERDRIRERISTVKADQKRRGRHLGGDRPFGYRVEGEGKTAVLVPDEGEQALIREAAAARAQGASFRAIATQLSERGHKISHVSVARVLRDHAQSAV
jgi:putative DNA-invertase from lambdoid prophage Rac